MKTLKTVIKIIGGILLFSIIILSILGYYLTRNDFSNPPEHYVSIGKRVYTTAPAMMIDESYDSLNLSGRGIKIGELKSEYWIRDLEDCGNAHGRKTCMWRLTQIS